MDFHKIAEVFPLMEGSEFDAFCEDIKTNGLEDDIVTHDGQILDGRNRYRACIRGGIKPRYKAFDGSDPIKFVTSKNLRRRHLDESQRAMVAARLIPLYEEEARKRERAGTEAPPGARGKSAEHAAKAANASVRSTERAKTVIDKAIPEVVDQVDAGTIPVSTAAEVARIPSAKQKAVAEFFADGKPAEAKKVIAQEKAKAAPKPVKLPKSGSVVFDDRIIDKLIGQLTRAFDDRGRAYGKGQEHGHCIAAMNTVVQRFNQWQHKTSK